MVVHKPQKKKSEWTHEFMRVSEADKRRFRHGNVTLKQLKRKYFWEPCKIGNGKYDIIQIPDGNAWEFCDVKTLSSDGEGIEEHKMVDKRFVIETKADEAYQTAQRVGLQSTGTHLGGREVQHFADVAFQ